MTADSPERRPDIDQLMRAHAASTQRLKLVLGLVLIVVATLAVVVARGYLQHGEQGPSYKTAEARRGDLTVKVTATGTLQPLDQVDVGIEVSGTIEAVLVDYNDRVTTGQVLARLDTTQLAARARMSEAALVLARARVRDAEATVAETRAKLERSRQLLAKHLTAPEDFDTVQAAAQRADAGLAVARAQVEQSQGQLDADNRSLQKAVIHAPIDGIVLKRQVEPGQTVAATLQTPVLFTIAQNLKQMELHVNVDEADVGQVRERQIAQFTVDAYSNRTFPATITQVRYLPQTVQGVVTYETLLSVDNSELLLRPGMTATADITVREVKDVLLVPNAALRFTPPRPRATDTRNIVSKLMPGPPRQAPRGPKPEGENAKQPRVWTLEGGKLVPMQVTPGATDGVMTEITAGKLAAGTELVTDVALPARKP